MSSYRVMTFNIHHGMGADGILDVGRAAALISAQAPEVVAVQELDRGWPRSGDIDQVALLAELTGYEATFQATVVRDGGREYGHALFTRTPVDASLISLPRLADEEPRGVIVAETGGATFMATHLSRHQEARAAQIDFLARSVTELDRPVVLLGDLNSPKAGLGPLLAAGLDPGPRTVRTVPARWPRVQLDHILVGPPVRLTALGALRTTISDHRPLVGTVSHP